MTVASKIRRIFIVEDEKTVSKLIEIRLKNLFDEIKSFTNGLEAYRAIKKVKPDLVILDIMLPGMEGTEILQKIKTDPSLSHIKVLMLTAKSREEDVERAFELNADEYMSKPFKMNELKLRVDKLLN
jgi:DNA-binding response OmpR family regulator